MLCPPLKVNIRSRLTRSIAGGNITIGLPVARTSVDHRIAFDIRLAHANERKPHPIHALRNSISLPAKDDSYVVMD
jgi:4-hydroxy-L-threonine phosphate dehydrogenase PdxA